MASSPTTTVPGAPTTSNPFLQGTGATTSNPQDSDTSRFGLTSTELGTPIGVQSSNINEGTANALYGATAAPTADLDPFGLGIQLRPTNGQVTAQDLVDYIQQLPPSQLAQVQSELANAGFYGAMNTASQKPNWGLIGDADLAAISSFVKTAINGAQAGSSIQSVLARSTQQFSAQQSSSLTPEKNLGSNYTITNLDPQQAQDTVDKVSMAILGHTLDPTERTQYATWLNQQYTSQQMKADQGSIDQNSTNALATAQAQDLINPSTGQAIGGNSVVTAAQGQLGVKYVWGGTTPGQGLDCSGLTQYAAKQAGIDLPRTSQEQWNTAPAGSTFTDESQAQAGDLVFFGGDGTGPTHVGIYIGNGMMINAPHTGASVEYDNVQAFAQGDNLVGFRHLTPGATTTAAAATPGGGEGSVADIDTFMAAEKQQESGGDYTVNNSIGASGAYQMLQSTWATYAKEAGFGQYAGGPASAAPPDVQDAVAKHAFTSLYQQYGNWGDVAAAWYSGQPLNPADENNAQSGGPSIKAYSDMILAKMKTMGAAANDPSMTTVDQNGQPVTNLDSDLTGLAGTPDAPTNATDANGGRSIISTPNTFTQVQSMTQADMESELAAKIRADHPDEATGADYANAYNMLKTAIDPQGFNVATAGSSTAASTGTGG